MKEVTDLVFVMNSVGFGNSYTWVYGLEFRLVCCMNLHNA